MRRICVYCGSSPGARPVFASVARELGTRLVERGLGLVYGGASVGTMGVIADAVLAAGGEVHGVIPHKLVDAEVAHRGLTELHVVDTMHARKARMERLCDAFAVLPGAYGTHDELFEALTWAQLGYHAKPIGLLNLDGFYDGLLQHLDVLVREGFLRPENRELVLVEETPAGLLDRLAASWVTAR